ncbi:MAG TPA: DNA-processing protein DprA [Nocardioidaceae bacterium]|nr:DNA-processing protein DprA [Nocardioidaceae bacterium]
MNDREARVALNRLGEPGDVRMSGLVAELGAERVYTLLRDEREITGIYTDVAQRLRGLDPAADLAQADARGIRFVCPGDEEWPSGLDALSGCEPIYRRGGAPLGLWVRGPLSLREACARAVSVVGSRSATTYGVDVASAIAAHVAGQGFCVVSGAAFGIDQAAHRGAIAAPGPTMAVLACGVDRAYPAAHRPLLDYLADNGLVVSEVPVGCAPTRLRFLSRNRLIAALAQGTVVVEAAVRSGALNTASWTVRLSRVLMGVPGPVTSAPSEGVHELIRSGGATLVTRGEDVLELVAPAGEHLTAPHRGPMRPRDRLSGLDQQVLDAVPLAQAVPAHSIARTAGLGARVVVSTLSRLRGGGFVEHDEAGWRLGPAALDASLTPSPRRPA